MRRLHHAALPGLLGLLTNAACNVQVPVDPANLFAPIGDAVDAAQDAIAGAVADPLGSKPFPVILGGDETRVFYATNLGDVRLNFPGPTNDVVFPGLLGPSNLYRFQQSPRERELLQPLIPAGTYTGLATDGRYVAMLRVLDLAEYRLSVEVLDLATRQTRVLFDPTVEPEYSPAPFGLKVDGGRVTFLLTPVRRGPELLRVVDMTGAETALEIEADRIGPFVLRGDDLAFVLQDEGEAAALLLRDLSTGEELVIDAAIRVSYAGEVRLVSSPNRIVWAQPDGAGHWRISAYDLATGLTTVIAESAGGLLAGATDSHVITEEIVEPQGNSAARIRVIRYDASGRGQKLAEFRADGLAGQTTVLGGRAAWVNPDREIVLAPVAGGDRTAFRPF